MSAFVIVVCLWVNRGLWLMFDPACLCSRCGFRTAGWKTSASVWLWRGLTPPTRRSTPTWWATLRPRGTCPTPSHPTCRYLTTPTWVSVPARLRPPPLSPTLCAPLTVSGCCLTPTRGRSSCAPSDTPPCTRVRPTASVPEEVPAPAWPVTPVNLTASQPGLPARTSLAPPLAELTLLSLSRLQCLANPHLWH